MSQSRRHEVVWEGEVIGEVENLRCDNLNVFGKWHPRDTPTYNRFHEQLAQGNELIVQVGDLIKGRIDEPPSGELEIKVCFDP